MIEEPVNSRPEQPTMCGDDEFWSPPSSEFRGGC
jgi:hypothetical protein